nr:hypothetical protein [uncultured Romboutsia sp.]
MAIKSEDIKVTINYPEQLYFHEEIESIKARWIFERQMELYGEEILNIVYPLWIKSKESKR